MQNEAGAHVVIVAYRPKPGKRDDLLQLAREHVPYLQDEGLATARKPVIVETADGTVVEVFEWAPGAVEKAHHHPGVRQLWERYFAACDIIPLRDVPETANQFAAFKALD